jgi:hypothetical protein
LSTKVDIHELIAWELDEYSYRSFAPEFTKRVERAQQSLAERACHVSCPALLPKETQDVSEALAAAAQRIELQKEYECLDWALGIVDLRRLLGFQRRLVFDCRRQFSPVPSQNDWPGLISMALGSQRDTEHQILYRGNAVDGLEINLYSSNPDLQLRLNPKEGQNDQPLFSLYGGSPFFEVAQLRGRWFLRDGYHRAYRLLQAGVNLVPAVVIHARTLEELGATKPWFFGEDMLFSDRPPRITDFLDESLVLRYERTALRKIIRIRIEESLEPFNEVDEVQGEKI